MYEVLFVDVKPYTSCCKDLEVVYHVPSTIRSSTRHYVALREVGEDQSEFSWVWSGRTEPLEPESNGITVKWRRGKVVFASRVLPKLSDGREYYFIYYNEDGTTLGGSRPFQFCTDSDEFSSIDLQSVPSDNMTMVCLHKKAETSLHSNGSLSFEIVSEECYTDTKELSDVIQKKPHERTEDLESLRLQLRSLTGALSREDQVIKDVKEEIAALKDWNMSTSTMVVNSKKDKEKQILTRRIAEETKKSSQLKQLLRSKETKIIFLENEVAKLRDESVQATEKINQLATEKAAISEQLQTELGRKQEQPRDQNQMTACKSKLQIGVKMKRYYASLCSIVDPKIITPYFVERNIISIQEEHDLQSLAPSEQKRQLLHRVFRSAVEGRPQILFHLLEIMLIHCPLDAQLLAKEMMESLEMPFVSSNKLGDDQLIQLNSRLRRLKLMYGLDYVKEENEMLEQLLKTTQFVALYDFTARYHDELSFKKGDIIIFPSVTESDGWMCGQLKGTNQQGLFPLNYIRLLQ